VTVDNDDAMIDNGAVTVDNTVDDSDVIVDDDGVMMPLQRTTGYHHAHHQTPCPFRAYVFKWPSADEGMEKTILIETLTKSVAAEIHSIRCATGNT